MGFEPTYLPNPNREANHYAIEHSGDLWCFNIYLKHTRTSFLTSDILDVWLFRAFKDADYESGLNLKKMAIPILPTKIQILTINLCEISS